MKSFVALLLLTTEALMSQEIDISLKSPVCLDSSLEKGVFHFTITNHSKKEYYLRESWLLDNYVIFSDENEILRPSAKVNVRRQDTSVVRTDLHIINGNTAVEIDVLFRTYFAYDFDPRKKYRILISYSSVLEKKYKRTSPVPGYYFINPATFAYCKIDP